jgi:hypothetical protein
MTRTAVTLSARAQRMADSLAAWPRRRVQLAELWELLDQVDPSSRMDVRRRRILAELITELAAADAAELPAARSYDRSEIPALPRFLTLPCDNPAPELHKAVVWHPSLAWVPQGGLTRSQIRTVAQVNQWLHGSRDHLKVPSRERSLEVFGDEKALDRLVGTALFGPGRLSLELLQCRRVAPRLNCESAGDGDLLLVVENSDTFDSLLTVLRGRGDHRVGLVGWGPERDLRHPSCRSPASTGRSPRSGISATSTRTGCAYQRTQLRSRRARDYRWFVRRLDSTARCSGKAHRNQASGSSRLRQPPISRGGLAQIIMRRPSNCS